MLKIELSRKDLDDLLWLLATEIAELERHLIACDKHGWGSAAKVSAGKMEACRRLLEQLSPMVATNDVGGPMVDECLVTLTDWIAEAATPEERVEAMRLVQETLSP